MVLYISRTSTEDDNLVNTVGWLHLRLCHNKTWNFNEQVQESLAKVRVYYLLVFIFFMVCFDYAINLL